jgi:hypothetical protein
MLAKRTGLRIRKEGVIVDRRRVKRLREKEECREGRRRETRRKGYERREERGGVKRIHKVR